MYFEMRTYTIKLGKTQEYLQLFEEVALPIISKYSTLVGYWYTDIGDLNQVIHIWKYESLDDRAIKRRALYSDPEWIEKVLPAAGPLLEKQENKIMYAANFSPIK
ncbi:NIPSNAP family protein [Bacillus sp. Marseille-P3661]|uniref:NIPSNAP family protein n=1 Tax=Bacillus sp. Marseille-P3661 TaxID=1936234 RepID=UPI000C86234C|nr:NIPSNAP family protein [Bacillus sp. Marseille-P3661]